MTSIDKPAVCTPGMLFLRRNDDERLFSLFKIKQNKNNNIKNDFRTDFTTN